MKRSRGDELEIEIPPFVPTPLDDLKRKAVLLIHAFHGPDAEKTVYRDTKDAPEVVVTKEKIESASFFGKCVSQEEAVSLVLCLTDPPVLRIKKKELFHVPTGDPRDLVKVEFTDGELLRATGFAVLSAEADGFVAGEISVADGRIRVVLERPKSPREPEMINLSRLSFYFSKLKRCEIRLALEITPGAIHLLLRRIQFV